jgi:transcriptional regulator with PAS, ATPase and Fis domain
LTGKACLLSSTEEGDELLNNRSSEFIGKSFAPLIHPDDKDDVISKFMDTMQGNTERYDVRVLYDNAEYLLNVETLPIRENGTITGTVSFGRDITRSRLIEKEAGNFERILQEPASKPATWNHYLRQRWLCYRSQSGDVGASEP